MTDDARLRRVSPDPSGRLGFYYPFHLCSPESLERFLTRYDSVHFRDYMALQLTPTSGTTAAPDRMGDYHAALLQQGRIAQGRRIDRDLKDREWREMFHLAVRNDVRFQRGLVPEDTELTPWLRAAWTEWPITLAEVRQMSRLKLDPERAIALEYGRMLVKTSASLWYTIQLCQQYGFDAITDSPAHDRLLQRMTMRDRIVLQTFLLRQ